MTTSLERSMESTNLVGMLSNLMVDTFLTQITPNFIIEPAEINCYFGLTWTLESAF